MTETTNLVIGATGNVGSEVVKSLLADGQPVRILTRQQHSSAFSGEHVEVATGDLGQPDTLVPALQGVRAVFLLAGGDDSGTEHVQNVLTTLGNRKDVHIVLLSTLGADSAQLDLAKNHARRETILRESGFSWSIVRPSTFMSNTGQWAQSIRQHAKVFNPNGDGQTAPIAPEDIGAVAAKAMQDKALVGQTLEVTGPELMSTPQQVAVLAKVLDKSIECIDISVEAAVQNMLDSGFPERFARSLGMLMERIRSGQAAVRTETVQQVLGRPATTFEAWATAHKTIWL